MIYLEIVLLIEFLLLCIISTYSDLKEGMIYNKYLAILSMCAIITDSVYYGFFVRDIFIDFLINFLVVFVLSLVLFYSHSIAGGDCKLMISLSLCVPARMYIVYLGSIYTLWFAIGIAIFYGYIYMLCIAIKKIVTKTSRITLSYVKNYFWSFIINFFAVSVYMTLLNLCIEVAYFKGIFINVWIIRVVCFAMAWIIGKNKFIKKWYFICPVLAIVVFLSLALKTIPISINPENYILVVILLLCQMTIRTDLYEEKDIVDLKKGMILSTMSSMLFQGSRVRGLPKISKEDLRDRLSEEEIGSIKRWAESRKITTLVIVKKIPFAIFISLGFLSYLLLWGSIR